MSKSQLPLMIGIGTRIRKSPYYDSNLKYGVTGFTVYNKMYLPTAFSGPEKEYENNILDQKWMEEFGGLIGFRVSDLVENHNFTHDEIEIYKYPKKIDLEKKSIKGIFLGFYERWDAVRNYEIAKRNGFKSFGKDLEGCYFDFEKIDNFQHGIHDYFKFLKFGFGRATDQLCYMVRRKKISRSDAIGLARKIEGKYPKSYMGKPLEKILSRVNITIDEFNKICDKFTNKKIFKVNQANELIRDENSCLIKNKYDN